MLPPPAKIPTEQEARQRKAAEEAEKAEEERKKKAEEDERAETKEAGLVGLTEEMDLVTLSTLQTPRVMYISRHVTQLQNPTSSFWQKAFQIQLWFQPHD